MSDAPTVLTERRSDILLITLNRPAVRNAMNPDLAAALQDALDDLDADPELRVAVLCGAGPAFCAGADLKAPRSRDPDVVGVRERLTFLRTGAKKPTVCAVEGFALGGGMELALACDLIVCAEDARMGLPEVRWGLVPGGGGLLRLPRKASAGLARAMVLTAEPVFAEQLRLAGVVYALSTPGRAVEDALALATKIAANAPLAVAAAKAIMDATSHLSLEEAWATQEPLVGPVFASHDAREGRLAFRERRPPVWRNR